MTTTPESDIRHQNPVDDLRITVDRLAAAATGRPVVTIKFAVDPALIEGEPMERWTSIAVAEAVRRHMAERARTLSHASALDQLLRDSGL